MSTPAVYTQEQLDIALLKNTQEGIFREIHGFRNDMNSLRDEFHSLSPELRSEMRSMRDEIRNQGHWNIGLILGIYGMVGAAALAKVFGLL